MTIEITTETLRTCMTKFVLRAEKNDDAHLIETFVDNDFLFSTLDSRSSQIIYGRRGTGKTHALKYYESVILKKGKLVSYIDLRTVGSNNSYYSQGNIPVEERATCLLRDILQYIHEDLLKQCQKKYPEKMFDLIAQLDSFADEITRVEILGQISSEKASTTNSNSSSGVSVSLNSSPKVNLDSSIERNNSDVHSLRESGRKIFYFKFGSIQKSLERLLEVLDQKYILLLDEWSELPLDVQPFLADMLKKTFFPLKTVTVKIAAIEYRSNFRQFNEPVGKIGFELGADINPDIVLDDLLVHEMNKGRSATFFKSFVFKHVNSVLKEEGFSALVDSDLDKLITNIFGREDCFSEFVRCSEGVPRDSMSLLGVAAQKSDKLPLSIDKIRESTKTNYERTKAASISQNHRAQKLLSWIFDEVIGKRRCQGFFLEIGTRDELIDFLYDSRVIHLIKKNIGSQDIQGKRYDVFKIDSGCYIDLYRTKKKPHGLLVQDEDQGGEETYVDVPPEDYRSYRRSILKLTDFYEFLKKSHDENLKV